MSISKSSGDKAAGNAIAVILASGRGSRFGAPLPKQFCELAGRPLLMHTIDAFAGCFSLEDILLVIDPAMEPFWQELCQRYGYRSPRIAFGGATRTESLAKALGALNGCDGNTLVLIHDGARPLVSDGLIRRMKQLREGYAGAVPVVPVTDTVRSVGADGSHTVDRSTLRAVQTPQTFRLGTLRTAFADYRNLAATDDATLVQAVTGGAIDLVEGDTDNMKVTNPRDLLVAAAILHERNKNR